MSVVLLALVAAAIGFAAGLLVLWLGGENFYGHAVTHPPLPFRLSLPVPPPCT